MAIRLLSGGQYAWGVLRGKARPNPVTWFFWGLTPMIAFVAQLHEHVGVQALMTLALGVSPLAIFILSLFKSRLAAHLTPFTIACGILAAAGVVLWRLTNDATFAIVFSIVADIFAALPTLAKSYLDPDSEYALPYALSMLSMTITLLTIHDWQFAAFAFPLYMLAINTVLFCFAAFKLRAGVLRLLALLREK